MEPMPLGAKTDIVVVGYHGNGSALLQSIAAAGGDYRILFINNSRVDIRQRNLEYFRMPENIGWVKGANVGLAMSTAPYVVLLNDDVEIVTPGWLEILQSAFREEPKLACCVPVVNDPRWPKQQWEGKGLRLVVGQKGEHLISFFAVMFSREALVEIGYLDERFSPGYGDDTDWTTRAQLAGWKVGIHNDVVVKHQGAASFSKLDRGAIQERNRERLRAKWPGDHSQPG